MVEGIRDGATLAARGNWRQPLVSIKVYVEGGGDHNKTLDTRCRKGFREFFEKAGLEGRMPKMVACGGRRRAFENFRTSIGQRERSILLVDSESPIQTNRPWQHVKNRPGDGIS